VSLPAVAAPPREPGNLEAFPAGGAPQAACRGRRGRGHGLHPARRDSLPCQPSVAWPYRLYRSCHSGGTLRGLHDGGTREGPASPKPANRAFPSARWRLGGFPSLLHRGNRGGRPAAGRPTPLCVMRSAVPTAATPPACAPALYLDRACNAWYTPRKAQQQSTHPSGAVRARTRATAGSVGSSSSSSNRCTNMGPAPLGHV
jgi:hypothetical protein